MCIGYVESKCKVTFMNFQIIYNMNVYREMYMCERMNNIIIFHWPNILLCEVRSMFILVNKMCTSPHNRVMCLDIACRRKVV